MEETMFRAFDAMKFHVGDKVRIVNGRGRKALYDGQIRTVMSYCLGHATHITVHGYHLDDMCQYDWVDSELESIHAVHFELPDDLFEVT